MICKIGIKNGLTSSCICRLLFFFSFGISPGAAGGEKRAGEAEGHHTRHINYNFFSTRSLSGTVA